MNIKAEKMDETLKELLTGILFFELLALGIGIWFAESVVKYLIGLAIGMLLAVFSAIHMYVSIRKNLEINTGKESAANASSVKAGMIRYAVILVVFFITCLTDFAYPLAVFLGIMGLKAGAYIQPFTHKYIFHNEEDTI